MIQLNTDFTLLNRFFGISPSKIHQYANMNFEEIMKAEAKQGNAKAKNYEEILSDPDKILEIFKLTNVDNKLVILQNMSEHDLDELLPLLTNEQLALGLQFFNDEKLLTMTSELPIEELVGMVFENFNMFDILKLMDESSMDKFVAQPDVERRYCQTYYEGLQQHSLEKIVVHALGDEYKGKTKDEYLEQLEKMNDNDYSNFLISLERKEKMEMINTIVEQDEDLLTLFEPDDLVKPMTLIMKEDKIKMMKNLDKEFLTPMIQELPMDLTQIVLTQIDPMDFAKVIAEDFKNILSQVVLFSTKAG